MLFQAMAIFLFVEKMPMRLNDSGWNCYENESFLSLVHQKQKEKELGLLVVEEKRYLRVGHLAVLSWLILFSKK